MSAPQDVCTVTVTRHGFGLYEVSVNGRSSDRRVGLAVSMYAATRRGAFRAGRRIARDHYRREGAGSYRRWRFTVAPEAGQ